MNERRIHRLSSTFSFFFLFFTWGLYIVWKKNMSSCSLKKKKVKKVIYIILFLNKLENAKSKQFKKKKLIFFWQIHQLSTKSHQMNWIHIKRLKSCLIDMIARDIWQRVVIPHVCKRVYKQANKQFLGIVEICKYIIYVEANTWRLWIHLDVLLLRNKNLIYL